MTSADHSLSPQRPVPDLSNIYLYECSVVRGDGDKDRPGEVLWDQGIQTDANTGTVRYLISSTAELKDADNASIADLALSFVASYTCEGEMSAEEVNAFAASVIMHVTPYQREFVASLTTRMSVPTFVLPLLRLGQFELHVSDDEVSDENSDD